MNALELADLLETTESTNNQAATMLRQQQAEIENLMCLVNIQKAVSRDVDIDFLNETVDRQQDEIQAAIELVKKLQAERSALKNNLNFIVGINRLGLGVQKEGGLSSEEIEKIWLSIEEQRDDNFHYGWKKCEQYYGIRKAQE